MKTCSRCKIEKSLSEFNRRGSGWQAACRECNKEYYKKYYNSQPKEKERIRNNNRKRRETVQTLLNERKSVPCSDCRIQYPPYVMQFDHLDDKEFNISGSGHRRSIESILQEIEKCEVVCANCHAERTYQRRIQTGVGCAGIAR